MKKAAIVEFIFEQVLAGASTHSIASKIYDKFHVVIRKSAFGILCAIARISVSAMAFRTAALPSSTVRHLSAYKRF